MKVKARVCPSCDRLIKYPESAECWFCGSTLEGADETEVRVRITERRPTRWRRHRLSRLGGEVGADDLHSGIDVYRRWRDR